MITLYKYFFYQAYHFCIKVFKEKEFPWFFASGAVSMPFVLNMIVIWELIEYFIRPSPLEVIGEYYGYFSFSMLIITALVVTHKDNYLKMLSDINESSPKKKRVLKYFSFIYI